MWKIVSYRIRQGEEKRPDEAWHREATLIEKWNGTEEKSCRGLGYPRLQVVRALQTWFCGLRSGFNRSHRMLENGTRIRVTYSCRSWASGKSEA